MPIVILLVFGFVGISTFLGYIINWLMPSKNKTSAFSTGCFFIVTISILVVLAFLLLIFNFNY